MRVVVIGTTPFTLACARATARTAELVGVVGMPQGERPLASIDLDAFASENGTAHAEFTDLNGPAAQAWLSRLSPDWIVSSWPRILGQRLLDLPRCGVIGSHPTHLPHNRGRHPLHWTIALGLPEVWLTFFRMDGGVDSGPVLRRARLQVAPDDDIASLSNRVCALAESTLVELLRDLAIAPAAGSVPQDETEATTWRKRTAHDTLLDWRINVAGLVRLVRSFAAPFPCATLAWREGSLPVARAEASQLPPPPRVAALEPGRIVAVEPAALHVKAADGIVRLELAVSRPAALAPGTCLHPPSYYMITAPEHFREYCQ